jgi:hypothetical protein
MFNAGAWPAGFHWQKVPAAQMEKHSLRRAISDCKAFGWIQPSNSRCPARMCGLCLRICPDWRLPPTLRAR